MKQQKIWLICIATMLSLSVFAQIKKANEYFNNYDYARAIPLYEKIVKKKQDAVAIQNLAHSYRLTKQYKLAEIYYAKAVALPSVEPICHFFYGLVLKNNQKFDEAKKEFELYSSIAPDDKKGEVQVKSVNDIKVWISRPKQYEVSGVSKLNSKHSEFSPVLYKNSVVFTSDRPMDLVNYQKNDFNNQAYLSIFQSTYESKNINGKDSVVFNKVKKFSKQINTQYHDGPLCFNAEQNEIIFTRVDYKVVKEDKNFVNRPKLYFSKLNADKWEEPRAFQYNSDTYSVSHPSISEDGQMLFFVSDMPSGFGGQDIYVCKKQGDSWSTLENLGAEINTAGNEVFPTIRRDGKLFFSSDGQAGIGGLDLFSATFENEKWSNAKNLGDVINSSTDDFGIVFYPGNKKGFFSSDRMGGKGSDDIFEFEITSDVIDIAGKILFTEDLSSPVANSKIYLMKEDGTVVLTSVTDSTGYFKFIGLSADEKYLVQLDENDPKLKNKNNYYMADETGKIIRKTVINDKGGKFVFKNLPVDPSSLSTFDVEDQTINIAGNIYVGENNETLANTAVNLINEKGEIVQTVNTNSFGAFVFTNLPPDQSFIVKVAESDVDLAITENVMVTGENGKVVRNLKPNSDKKFKFKILLADTNMLPLLNFSEDKLRMKVAGKLVSTDGKPLANVRINLLDAQGNIVATAITNYSGTFSFADTLVVREYTAMLDDQYAKLAANTKIVVTNTSGKQLASTTTNDKGDFDFKFLGTDKTALPLIDFNDTKLMMNIKGALFGADGASPLAFTKVNLLDEKGNVVATTNTDEKGYFDFKNLPSDKNFLVSLDENDTKLTTQKKIFVADQQGNIVKEVKPNATGDFEFKILSTDKNTLNLMSIDDTDLRLDLKGKFLFDTKEALANSKITLVDDKGKVIKISQTDELGNFEFKGLPGGKNYSVIFDEKDSRVMTKSKLLLMNDKGEVIETMESDKSGKFRFKILPQEQEKLGYFYVEDPWLKAISLKGDTANGNKKDMTIIENVYYDFGDWRILPEARKVLDKVVDSMKGNNQIVVFLSSHTDSRATEEYNQRLSDNRAKVAVDYITSKGIENIRVAGKGFGESKLVNQCKDGVECTDEQHRLNRRTEFKIMYGVENLKNEKSAYYSGAKSIGNDMLSTFSNTSGVYFTVQIGAFLKPSVATQNKYKSVEGVMVEKFEDFTRYTVGKFASWDEVSKARTELLNMGFGDAFVTARNNGKIIPFTEAKKMLQLK